MEKTALPDNMHDSKNGITWLAKRPLGEEILVFLGIFAVFELMALIGWLIGGFSVFRILTIIFTVMFLAAFVIYKITTGSDIQYILNETAITQKMAAKDAARINSMPLFSNVFSLFRRNDNMRASEAQITTFKLKTVHTIIADGEKKSFRLKSGLSTMHVRTNNSDQFSYLNEKLHALCPNAEWKS